VSPLPTTRSAIERERCVSDEPDGIMFEVYRDGSNGRYHVVYFTELDEHDRDQAIDAALAGEHFFDGFIDGRDVGAAKQVLAEFVARLNSGEPATAAEIEVLLQRCLAERRRLEN
jgi:hypothetical protein